MCKSKLFCGNKQDKDNSDCNKVGKLLQWMAKNGKSKRSERRFEFVLFFKGIDLMDSYRKKVLERKIPWKMKHSVKKI